ncbi:hypothetical protein LXA43DRAFT_1051442 [Ganoderma leucocontextum]|nr:hypothetical protein LXA43DRAFT_1051442 [Ganoderma leucocontextum]
MSLSREGSPRRETPPHLSHPMPHRASSQQNFTIAVDDSTLPEAATYATARSQEYSRAMSSYPDTVTSDGIDTIRSGDRSRCAHNSCPSTPAIFHRYTADRTRCSASMPAKYGLLKPALTVRSLTTTRCCKISSGQLQSPGDRWDSARSRLLYRQPPSQCHLHCRGQHLRKPPSLMNIHWLVRAESIRRLPRRWVNPAPRP